MKKTIQYLLIFSVFLCVFAGVKVNAFADEHVHVFDESYWETNMTKHWHACTASNCYGPNQTAYPNCESHYADHMWGPDCSSGWACICGVMVVKGYPNHDIPIEGGKCRHAGCNVECDHTTMEFNKPVKQKGICNFCGTNLTDASANVYVHEHCWYETFDNLPTEWYFLDCDENYHWYNCNNPECDITDNSQKLGFAAHTYELDETCATEVLCTECDYVIRKGYSTHDFSNGEVCAREDCSMTCLHSLRVAGVCKTCGKDLNTKPATESSETNTTASAGEKTDAGKTEGGAESAEAGQAVNSSKDDASKDIASIGNSETTEGLIVQKTDGDTKDSSNKQESGAIKAFFNRIGSFFKNLFKRR